MSVFTFNLHSFHIHIVNDDFLVHTYSGHGSKQNGQITSLQ